MRKLTLNVAAIILSAAIAILAQAPDGVAPPAKPILMVSLQPL
jgi:hypothetical protein